MFKTSVIGRLGSDAIITQINGKNAIKFNVAVSEPKSGDPAVKKDPTWISCTIWKEKDDSKKIAEFLKKGQQVYIEGRVKAGSYSKDGVAIPVLNLSVYNLQLLGSSEKKKSEEEQSNGEFREVENTLPIAEEDERFANLL